MHVHFKRFIFPILIIFYGNVSSFAQNAEALVSIESATTIGLGGDASVTAGHVRRSGRASVSAEDLLAIGKDAHTVVGRVSGNGGSVTVQTDDVSSYGGTTTVGESTRGGNVVAITEDVATYGRGSTTVARDGNVYANGRIINFGGDLTVGGPGCAGYRNRQCCIEFHMRRCAIRILPPNNYGGCPPSFIFSPTRGMCYLFSDFAHSVGVGR